eukprot:scaffold4140_cov81-Cylindrotheca_fusiformis.AAC.2
MFFLERPSRPQTVFRLDLSSDLEQEQLLCLHISTSALQGREIFKSPAAADLFRLSSVGSFSGGKSIPHTPFVVIVWDFQSAQPQRMTLFGSHRIGMIVPASPSAMKHTCAYSAWLQRGSVERLPVRFLNSALDHRF